RPQPVRATGGLRRAKPGPADPESLESRAPISGVNSGGRCTTFGEDWILVEEVGDASVVGVGEG
ncbi:MAG: hypothetical protein U9N84_09990, partial [Actinomycetota bacterium]|nr:hypothetical protein [Actinomycetota bacterium]